MTTETKYLLLSMLTIFIAANIFVGGIIIALLFHSHIIRVIVAVNAGAVAVACLLLGENFSSKS